MTNAGEQDSRARRQDPWATCILYQLRPAASSQRRTTANRGCPSSLPFLATFVCPTPNLVWTYHFKSTVKFSVVSLIGTSAQRESNNPIREDIQVLYTVHAFGDDVEQVTELSYKTQGQVLSCLDIPQSTCETMQISSTHILSMQSTNQSSEVLSMMSTLCPSSKGRSRHFPMSMGPKYVQNYVMDSIPFLYLFFICRQSNIMDRLHSCGIIRDMEYRTGLSA